MDQNELLQKIKQPVIFINLVTVSEVAKPIEAVMIFFIVSLYSQRRSHVGIWPIDLFKALCINSY
jgi:hypothetical protein